MTIRCAFAAFMAACVAMPAIAEPPPFRDFTFKRVGVPKKGQVNRLVQIDPAEQARILAVPKRAPSVAPEGEAFAALPDAAPKSAKYDWFWKKSRATVSAPVDSKARWRSWAHRLRVLGAAAIGWRH